MTFTYCMIIAHIYVKLLLVSLDQKISFRQAQLAERTFVWAMRSMNWFPKGYHTDVLQLLPSRPPQPPKNGNQGLQLEPPIGPCQLLRWKTEWWYSGRLDMQPALRNLLPVYFDIRTVLKYLNGFRCVSYWFLKITVRSLSQCSITYGRKLGDMGVQRHSK
jgi:hypothetical protein